MPRCGRRPKRVTDLVCIGAHPDDAEEMAGGLAALCAQSDGRVLFLSMTDGSAGHHEMAPADLTQRRRREARAAASLIGAEADDLAQPDAALVPSIELRDRLVQRIREWKPDVLVTHRPNDYHPDHRSTGQLVSDCTYLLTVPRVVSVTPPLAAVPVVLHASDSFQRPYPFQANLIFDIDAVIETKIDLLSCHESQVYEWLPYQNGRLALVPDDARARREWLAREWDPAFRRDAERFRTNLVARYGKDRGERIRYAEAFEVCEYGRLLTARDASQLFPF